MTNETNKKRNVHKDSDWRSIVRCVPKDETVIPDKICEKITTAFKNKEKLDVLDIGGGEGLLSFSIFNKLKINKSNINTWAVIEGGKDEDKEKYEDLLDKYEKKFEDFFKVIKVCQEIKDTTEWFDTVLESYDLPNTFDLIIISHVTYYFQDGGLKLANEIVMNRLNSSDAFAWFVVRDKNCKFYEERSKFLALHGLRDFYSHQFSSYFMSYCWSLFSDVKCQKQIHNLCIDTDNDFKAWEKTIFLFWTLNDYQVQYLDKAYLASIPTEFSEHHILVPAQANDKLPHSTISENNINAAITIADCTQEITNVIASANLIRCSVSTIQPELIISENDLETNKHIYYITANGFVNQRGTNLFEQFLSENESFLNIQSFYYDNTIIFNEASENERNIKKVKRYDFLSPVCKAPYIDETNRVREINKKSHDDKVKIIIDYDIDKAWQSWTDLLQKNLNMNYETAEAGRPIWTMAVGLPLTKVWESMEVDEDGLSGRIAFFATVQILPDYSDKEAADLFRVALNNIKVRLIQDLSARAYHEVKRQKEKIEAREKENQLYQFRFKSLQNPLVKIAQYLHSVNIQVNDMERLLYNPNTSLLAHHKYITELFDTGKNIQFGSEKIIIRHDPQNYASLKEAKYVFLRAIIGLLGIQFDYTEQNTEILLEKMALRIIEINDEKDLLLQHSLNCLSQLLFKSNNMSTILNGGSIYDYKSALYILKQTFHTTFKPITNQWPMQSLFVALWPRENKLRYSIPRIVIKKEGVEIPDYDSVDCNMFIEPDKHTPIPYTIILTFIIALADECTSREQSNPITECLVSYCTEHGVCLRVELKFLEPYIDGANTLSRHDFRKFVKVIAMNRDRTPSIAGISIYSDTVGDLIRPWRDLIRTIQDYGMGWESGTLRINDVLCFFRGERSFFVEVDSKCITLCWKNT